MRTRPACVCGGIWVVPILSWYHSSFDTEPDITGWSGIPPIEEAMMDFKVCKWPEELGGEMAGLSTALAEHFDSLNEQHIADEDTPQSEPGVSWAEVVAECTAARAAGRPVISFSHFLPRLELLPEKRFLFLPTLAKAVGSKYLYKRVLEIQVRPCNDTPLPSIVDKSASLRSGLMDRSGVIFVCPKPDIHLFGHTHFGWDATLDGIRYVQAPLSYPNERKMRLASIKINNFPGAR